MVDDDANPLSALEPPATDGDESAIVNLLIYRLRFVLWTCYYIDTLFNLKMRLRQLPIKLFRDSGIRLRAALSRY